MTDLSSKVKNTLDEGRILIIGAQVLLGFQFRAVFEQGFEQLPSHGKYLSLVSLGVMVLAVSLLIWPASYHQIVEKGEDSLEIQRFGTAVLDFALLPFALGVAIDFFIAGELMFGEMQGAISGVVALLVAISCWYLLGFIAKRKLVAKIEKEQQMSAMEEEESGGTKLKDKIEQVLTELRVALPGAQALLGFQFSVLFVQSFEKLPQSMKIVHFLSLSFVALTVILLMTPAAYHRIVYRGEQSESFHQFASKMLLAALIPLAVGMAGDFYVVSRKVTDSGSLAIILAATALFVLLGMWFGLTIRRRRERRETASA